MSSSSTSSKGAVSVSLTYSIPKGSQNPSKSFQKVETTQSWTVDTMGPRIRVGLPAGTQAVKPSPGDCTYSGMHDDGPMVEPKEDASPMVDLLTMVQQAKTHNDSYLTQIIHDEKEAAKLQASKGS